ncbi:methyltransferase domain-containing protein [Microbacteriaceae bacterium 4G12]
MTAHRFLLRPDRYPLSSRYDPQWLLGLDMGPHPLWQLEDLLTLVPLTPGQRVLDLGCGRGATSVFLAQQCGVEVVAFDLWIDPAEIRAVVESAGVGDRVDVVQGDARSLPFADGEFDAIVSIDAFEYFGADPRFLPGLLRVLRPDGRIGMTTPALREDPYVTRPPDAVLDLVGWEAAAWHSPDWWETHWALSGLVDGITARMQAGSRDDWLRWSRTRGSETAAEVAMLESDPDPDWIGFALVAATKRASAG